MKQRSAVLGMACCVVVALSVAACGGSGSGDSGSGQLRGIQRTPLPAVGEVALPEADGGADVRFVADPGGLLVVYFGFTHCPDVCPTTLSDLRSALEELGDGADEVDVAMATVDPDRDTAEMLTPYVQSFFPDARALRTTDDTELQAVADVFGVTYDVVTNEDGEVEVSHSGFLYAVDDRGKLAVSWPFGTTPEDIAHDLGLLLDEEVAT